MTTTAIGSTSRVRERNQEEAPVALAGRRFSTENLSRVVSAKIDADLAAFVASVVESRSTPRNDDVVLVSLNPPSANAEAAALASTGARLHRIASSTDDVGPIHRFTGSLGVPPKVATDIACALSESSPGERAMLAAIASAWASAERGGACPSRLVISGHSGDGSEIYGSRGFLTLENVQKLARAMPRAAAQVEDIHLSACSSAANAAGAAAWRDAFPNAKSIWSYNGAAPSPAAHHLLAWARMTKGRGEMEPLDDGLARANVAVWTSARGYENRGLPLVALSEQVRIARDRIEGFLDGTKVPAKHGDDAEHDFRALVDFANRAGVAPGDRARAAREAACLVRLRYYETVRTEFAKEHRAAVADGFGALGLPPPDFAKLTRRDALAAVARFETALARRSPPPSACAALAPSLRGFAALDPKVVPQRWCH